MRARGFLALVSLGAVLACATAAPSITHRRSGASTGLEGLRGKVAVVNFWAEWCKPCIQEIPEMARLTDGFGPEVMFLPVYYRPDPGSGALAAWLDGQPAYFRDRVCFGNSAFLHDYDLRAIPQTFVYGRDGQRVRDFKGSIQGTRLEELRTAIAQALGKSVAGLDR